VRAIAIVGSGGPEVLRLVDRPRPEPDVTEVRVRVHATAVNRADLLQRMGVYPAPPGVPADVPGLEFAGVIDAVGSGVVSAARIGERVFGLVGGGSYAEHVVTDSHALARIPDGMSFEEAAAVPEAFITAYDAMVDQGDLRAGQPVLVHAVGSGVGSAAVQLARALGATVIGTSRTPDKLERARALGLDHGIAVEGGKFADAVRAVSPDGVPTVLDLVGGAYLDEDLRCLRPSGRVVLVGLSGGARAQIDLARLLARRAHVIGTVLRSRRLDERVALHTRFASKVVPLLAGGALRAVIHRVLPLEAAAEAHAALASNETFGKIVLRIEA
jgi:putative PIG3 family NAD(P)H quinone oxidoreductase